MMAMEKDDSRGELGGMKARSTSKEKTQQRRHTHHSHSSKTLEGRHKNVVKLFTSRRDSYEVANGRW